MSIDQRVIKFRAAFPLTNTIHDVTEILWSDRTVYLLNGLGNGRLESLDAVHLLQFTGLHDKNGREIYEGDLLKCYDTAGNVVLINHQVELPSFFQEVWSHKKSNNVPTGLPCEEGTTAIFSEIIGNIYENPELLK
jgi:uncharacterized phage protein (TIGR01671 family)